MLLTVVECAASRRSHHDCENSREMNWREATDDRYSVKAVSMPFTEASCHPEAGGTAQSKSNQHHELLSEDLITLAHAARVVAAGGPPPHISTLHRWRTRGVGGIRLECVRFGRRVVTSKQALARFACRLEGEGRAPKPPFPDRRTARTPAERDRAVEIALDALNARGVKASGGARG